MTPHYDLELHLALREAGWSTARFFLPTETREFELTHALGEHPLRALAEATLSLATGASVVWFSWFAEPGRFDFRLALVPDARHHLRLSCWEEPDLTTLAPRHRTDEESITWEHEVALSHWVTLVHGELAKIAALLRQKPYAAPRRDADFPFDTIRALAAQL